MKKIQLVFLCVLIIPLFSFQVQEKSSIKVALILDTSNSMDGLIDQAKSQLWSVVNELAKARCDGQIPDLEIALYEYGNDQLSMREGYIRLVTPFTGDLDLISEKLFALRTDGGSEYCGQVIQASLKALDWEDYSNDLKMIFIAGNEPFNQGNVSYREVCKEARERGITVNTIFCGNFEGGKESHWKDGAYIGGGDYMNIDQDCQYVHIKSPYDKRLLELNNQLNSTYVAYGVKGANMYLRQSEQDANASGMSQSAAIKRTEAKCSTVYKNSDWDLIDACDEETFELESILENDLPTEMKGLTIDEKKAYLDEKKQERKGIQKEIGELTSKREKYVAEQRKDDVGNTLDKAIIIAVEKQASLKNFVFVD